MFQITVGVVGESLEQTLDGLETAVARIKEASDPPESAEAVGYAFHDNDEWSAFSAQITRVPSLRIDES